MKNIIFAMMTLVSLGFVCSCGGSKKVSRTTGNNAVLYEKQWTLIGLNEKVITNSKAHLLFSPGQPNKVSGSTGCNRLGGTFELRGVNFMKFSPLITTKMACAGDNIEFQFIQALAHVDNWKIIGNELLLYDGSTSVAKFSVVMSGASKLSGTWELNYISGTRIAFEGLYPDKKPQVKFNLAVNELGGNTSCNGFSSKITIDGNKLTVSEPFAKTMIFCEGGGEAAFLDMLKKVKRYTLPDSSTLTFMIDDVALMRFTKKM